jgi:copper chaperone CopZ
MKSVHIYMMVMALFVQSSVIAQIQSVSLQARGLTCSMCSRAIYKSLQKVPNVANVQEDIEHSSYHVQFNNPSLISPEKLKKAVLDAGFSVAWMEVNINFHNTEVASDSSLKLNELIFYFVDVNKQILNGEKKLLIVDKDYLQEGDRKKFIRSNGSGLSGDNGEKIYHVTLSKS